MARATRASSKPVANSKAKMAPAKKSPAAKPVASSKERARDDEEIANKPTVKPSKAVAPRKTAVPTKKSPPPPKSAAKQSRTVASPKKAAATKKTTSSPPAKKAAAKPKPSKKRARDAEEDTQPAAKRTKAAPAQKAPHKPKVAKPLSKKNIVNDVPTIKRHTYVMGEGSAGELGLGATKGACNVNRPRLNKILEEKGILDLAVGGMHCIALTVNNELLTWGVNDNKALGRPLPAWTARDDDEDASDYDDDEGLELNPYESLPTAIPKELFPEGTVFTQVAAGDSATFAVTDEGLVYGWGTFRNSEGIWGFTEDENGKIVKEQNIPLLIKNLKNIKSVSCGDNHALAIDNKGLAFAWGSGQQDQLGRRIVARHAQKNLAPAPVPIPKKAQIAQVIAGPNHNFAIEKDGSVWSWGLNNFAQTGIPYGPKKDNDIVTAPTRVKALKDYKITSIGVGANHSVAVTDEGDLLTFGRLENWALGIKVDSELTNNAELVRKSEHGFPKILLHPTKIDIPAKFTSISCGPDHNIAITTEGKAWGWGFNANLQLGVGRDDDEVKMPELINSKSIQDVKLDWAGCGGQFSMVGSSMHTSE